MAKLVVEVVDASDLLPTDEHGSASPFVEVDFDGRRQRTHTKTRDLYPSWNEKLVFDIHNPRNLHNPIIDVTLYDDRCANRHKNFLGCVQISGSSVPLSESEAAVRRYPLCKRGSFSHGRGDMSLRIYAVRAHYYRNQPQHRHLKSKKKTILQEFNGDSEKYNGGDKRKEKENEMRTFYSAGTSGGDVPASKAESGSNSTKAGAADVIPLGQSLPPDHVRGSHVEEKATATSYDLVEEMAYLFVKVVKARDLPVTDATGDLDPYVEVKFTDYKVVTRHVATNKSPVWDEVFAFCEQGLGPSFVEVVVKDFDTDEFVGRIVLSGPFPLQVQADSPLTPQWYELENRDGDKVRGEIMLAVWKGTQADDAYPGAWLVSLSDRIGANRNLANTRSNVYVSPTLYYLRIRIIDMHLVPLDENKPFELLVKLQLGSQVIARTSHRGPVRNKVLMFVVSEPFDDLAIVFDVFDLIGPGKTELIGTKFLPVSGIPQQFDSPDLVQARWINLNQISSFHGGEMKKLGSMLVSLCLETGYHVSDSRYGDFQPSARHLRKDSIGSLELAILGARNLPIMKQRHGGTTDAYCVVKYGNKWIRTRTIFNSQEPCWNEQSAWEVYDPCTVITIGVFNNCHVNGGEKNPKDMRIGKVKIQLQTLEGNRSHTHYHPILLVHPSGLKTHGELQVAVRFTAVAWANMLVQYTKPVWPKMHYLQPLTMEHQFLDHHAFQMVVARLSKEDPPLNREIMEYMLEAKVGMWSLRKHKANFHCLMSFVLGITAMYRWFDKICHWRNPLKTIFVHVVYLVFVWYPKLILPTFFLSLSMVGLWNYRFRPSSPHQLDPSQAEAIDLDHLGEEFDTFPTSQPIDIVRTRYGRLRSIAGRYQTVAGDIASQVERAMVMLTWRDSRATLIFTVIAFVCAVLIYVASLRVVVALLGLYWLRHPLLRSKMPPVLVNLFQRLPSKTDMLL